METILNNEYFITVYHGLTYIGLSFILFFVGKIVYQLFHQSLKVNDELVEKDNLAFAFAHVGYFIGLILIIGGVLIGPSNGIISDTIDIIVYGLLGILLLNIAIIINDKLVLNAFSVKKEIIEDQNVGTGVIEAANSIASGLVLFGALLGESDNLVHGIITASVFWALGQVVLFITAKIYNIITPYNIHEHIEKDNVAVGVGFAGALLAMGNIIRFAIKDDFENWVDSLTYVGIIILIGLVLLPILRFLTDKILLPGQKITDEIVNQEKPNIGAAIIEAFAYIAGSVLISWCL
jgi:uncharacterized membrane protein YjfL (UPF0719 family)